MANKITAPIVISNKQNNVFFISDTHFSHNLLVEKRGYESIKHMNDVIATIWSATVKPGDTVYHLGDVCFNPKTDLGLIASLPGKKRLILGNHDKVTQEWHRAFQCIRGAQRYGGTPGKYDGLWLTHIPCHPSHIRGAVNVHGHLHHGPVVEGDFVKHKQYININWDVVGGRLINYEELIS